MLGDLGDLLKGKRRQSEMFDDMSTVHVDENDTAAGIVSLRELKIRRVLGEGAFGKVTLAKSRADGKLYALKAQAKANITKNGIQEKLIMEFRLMKELNHPFIVRCHSGFQDTKYVYFLLGLLPGKYSHNLIASS